MQDGQLNIRATRQFTGNGGYTSARISTKGQSQFQFGKIAARIKLPKGRAVWPSFWMMGSVSDLDPWPMSGEIDIMEMRGGKASEFKNNEGGDQKIYGSIHYFNSLAPGHVGWGQSASLDRPFADDYHIFEVEWYDTRIVYKLDGVQYGMAQYNDVNEMHELHAWPYYLLLQVAVGSPGTLFTGNLMPDDSVFPQTMSVDWVRVYQTKEMQTKEERVYKDQGIVYNVSSETKAEAGNVIDNKIKIDIWNPNGFIISNGPGAAEGQSAIALKSDGSQNWFGIGYTVGSKVDLGGYRYLSVSLKTTSSAAFKIGASAAYGSWVYFTPSSDPYGFKRDGQWHTLHIPLSDFLQPEYDWGHVDYAFALSAANIKGPTEIDIDGIYYDNKSNNPDDYLLIPTAPVYYLDKDDKQGVDELNGALKSQIWNFLGFDIQPITDCVMGKECNRLTQDGTGYWLGYAFAGTTGSVKLIDYTSLEFAIRTSSAGKLKVSISDDKGKTGSIELQDSNYNLPRDGQWHKITVPLSAFGNEVNLRALKTVFTLLSEDTTPYQVDLDALALKK